MSQSQPSNVRIILFMVILSFICAFVLSAMSSILENPKAIAKQLDRSKQMMIAAKILTHEGYFLMQDEQGGYVPAKFAKGGALVPSTARDIPTRDQLLQVFRLRLIPRLVNDQGKVTTFDEVGLDEESYIAEYKKSGYYREQWKLIYEILPNPNPGQQPAKEPIGYVVPVNGQGLWDAIYGYLAVKPDGNTVIGISWYDQKETPGLGANIADAPWQSQFPGKQIFQPSPSGETDLSTAPIGISVVKGKVSEVLGDSPKAKSAVDGISGATLTGNGVTEAYKTVLSAYRPFFIKLHQEKPTTS